MKTGDNMRRTIYCIMGDHECTKEKTVEFLKETIKPIKYTHGLGYRGPTINKVPVNRKKAIEIFNTNSLCDVTEYEDYVHVNTFSGNDMW